MKNLTARGYSPKVAQGLFCVYRDGVREGRQGDKKRATKTKQGRVKINDGENVCAVYSYEGVKVEYIRWVVNPFQSDSPSLIQQQQ